MSEVVGSVTVEIIPDTTNFGAEAKQKLAGEQKALQTELDAQRYRQAEEVARAQVKITEEQLAEIQKLHANASGSVKASLEEQMAAITQVRDQYKEAVGTLFDPSSPSYEPFKDVTAKRANLDDLGVALDSVTQKNLIGMASEAELAAVTKAHGAATLSAARAEVVFAESMGMTATKEDIAILKREKLRQENELLRVSTDRLSQSERRRGAGTLRENLRNIGQGEGLAGIGGLGGLAKLTGVGIAITAAYRVVGELSQALKVTGDEAFTTEGKLRNMGAALIGADIVGFFRAASAEAKSYEDQVADLAKEFGLLAEVNKLQQFEELKRQTLEAKDATVEETKAVHEAIDAKRTGIQASGRFSNALGVTAKALDEESKSLGKAVIAASAWAAALKEAEEAQIALIAATRQASLDSRTESVADELASARRAEAAARKKANESAPQGPGSPKPSPQNIQDEAAVVAAHTRVIELEKALAEEERRANEAIESSQDRIGGSFAARTESLNDDLVRARKKEAKARKKWADASKADKREAYEAVVLATTERIKLEQQIAAQQKTADDKTLSEAKSAYSRSVSNQAERLKIAADASALVTAADKAYLAYLVKESRDRKLTEQERLRFQREATSERDRQKQEVVAAAKADIDYQRSLLDLAVQKAEQLTPGKKDDERAYRAQIAYWENEKKKAKALGRAGREAFVAADSELTSWKAKLKDLKGGGDAFTLQQLFQEAADQFNTFGSNIAGRNGVLSGQDERAAFGKVAGRRAGSALDKQRIAALPPGQARMERERMMSTATAAPTKDPMAASLTEAQKQTSLLETLVAQGRRGRTSDPDTVRDADQKRAPTVAHHAAQQQATHVKGQ